MEETKVGTSIVHRALPCVIFGDRNVGKTLFIFTNIHKRFPTNEEYIPSHYDSSTFLISQRNNVNYNVYFYDLSGFELSVQKFRIESYLSNGVIIIMYSISNRKSFENIKEYYNEIRKDEPNVPIIIVGTQPEHREEMIIENNIEKKKYSETVSLEEAQKLILKLKVSNYFEWKKNDLENSFAIFREVILLGAFSYESEENRERKRDKVKRKVKELKAKVKGEQINDNFII